MAKTSIGESAKYLMDKSEITKLLLLRGESASLPILDEAEFAYTRDQGRLFVGQNAYSDILERSQFPYQNLEILTENSTQAFATMHGARIKSGLYTDYYDARLYPTSDVWQSIEVMKNGEMTPYRITDISSVMLMINYAIYEASGISVRTGLLRVSHFQHYSNPREPVCDDQGNSTRQAGSYDPRTAFQQKCLLRFRVINPVSEPELIFEYRNTGSTMLNFRFRVSRPDPA